MAKCIVIETCASCPNHDHAGAFGRISYIPLCRAETPPRTLPYTVGLSGSVVVADATDVIPDWCPLEDR